MIDIVIGVVLLVVWFMFSGWFLAQRDPFNRSEILRPPGRFAIAGLAMTGLFLTSGYFIFRGLLG